ncbi:MAG: sodium:solute symporter family protein [Verrucomicrobia bacterium]|nr:sodium:solute symporter family protein [Verrucomicrobiota bacterium]MBV8486272.1 sodium:solute symporter family protein [Verrucomicrobiota bacterium]
MKSWIALLIILVVIICTIGFGIFGVRRIKMNPSQFILGGRSFGVIFLWLLSAGEVYTSFTFLGAAGWAYSRGAPAFYILCYLTVSCITIFFYMPPVWRIARQHGLLTNADYFAHQYQSRALGFLTGLVGVVFMIPYITLQLTGIQILLQIAGYGAINSVLAAGGAFGLIIGFVLISGLRGAAWASLVKDALVLAGVIFAGIVLPIHFFGSPQEVISRVLQIHPNWMTLAGPTENYGTLWFASTVLLSGLGGYIWPHAFASQLAAKGPDTIRRNAMILPIYQIMLLLVFFAGFTALLVKPGIKGQDADQSFMLVVQEHYPAWLLGLIAGAGCLAALVPASAQILAAASLLSRNLFPAREERLTQHTRLWIIVLALLAFGLWVYNRATLVGLLLIGYSGITQLFPGVVLSLRKPPPHAWSVASGIVVALVLLSGFALKGVSVIWGAHVGTAALAVNVVCLFVVDFFIAARRDKSSP